MSKRYLIINTGSASKKYAFYVDEGKLYTAHFEKEAGTFIVTEKIEGENIKSTIDEKTYQRAIEFIINSLLAKNIIKERSDLDLSGIRIVAPGEYFLKNRFIDEEYLRLADEALAKVPLHLAPALEEISILREVLGKDHLIVGVSDSAIHASIPDSRIYYGIKIADSRSLGLRRFGYHGISVQSVVRQAEKIIGYLPEKVIVCHLGGGASITAVKNGKSVNTTMGFTPLEGLIMATRVGDIDPGAVIYLMEKLGKDESAMGSYFNNECGLLGLSGKSDDIRDLLALEASGDKDSALALEVYVERIKQNIGRMAASLGGVDLLILAGTVGERSFIMRERICRDLEFLGIRLDQELNNQSEGVEVSLEKASEPVKILVVKTDEMSEIAAETLRISKQDK